MANALYDANGVMQVELQMLALRDWLKIWADKKGGQVKVLSNLAKLWQEIFVVDDSARILICWNGDLSRGGFAQANTLHRVDRGFIVVVLRGANGFTGDVATGTGQTGTPGAVDPFVRDVNVIRDKCRVMLTLTEEPPVDYKGTKPLPNVSPFGQNSNVFIDGYSIEFSTANDIPAVTSIDPDAV